MCKSIRITRRKFEFESNVLIEVFQLFKKNHFIGQMDMEITPHKIVEQNELQIVLHLNSHLMLWDIMNIKIAGHQ